MCCNIFKQYMLTAILALSFTQASIVAATEKNEQHLSMEDYLQAMLDESNRRQEQAKLHGYDNQSVSQEKSNIVLGNGYSSEQTRMLNKTCLNPGVYRQHNSYNRIDIDKRWTRIQLKQRFGYSIGVDVNYKMFNASHETSFVYDSVENLHSESFTFASQIQTESAEVRPNRVNDSFFTVDAQNIINRHNNEPSDDFKNMCGDRVISSVNYGGELYMSVQLNFYNRKDKAEFKSRTNVSHLPLGRIAAEIKKNMEFFLDTGEIKIMALQIGGNAAKLNQILRGDDADNPFPITTCSFEKIDDCHKMLAALASYASDTKNGFPSQLDPDHPDYKPKVMISGVELESYRLWNESKNPSTKPVFDPEVLKIRREVAKDYEQSYEDLTKAVLLREVIIAPSYKKKLENIIKILSENVTIHYPTVARYCFTESKEDCLKHKNFHYDEFINDPERYVDRKLIYPRYEEWKVDYSLLYHPQQRRCKASWIFNSNDGDKNLYDVYTDCHNVTLFKGVGHLWQTSADKPKFIMSAYSEKHGFDTFYGTRNGLQVHGLYLSENRHNSYDEWSERSLLPTIEREFVGGIVEKDPDTYVQNIGEKYE